MSVGQTLASAALSLFFAFAANGQQTAGAPVGTVRISGTVLGGSDGSGQYEAVRLALIGNRDSLKVIAADGDGKFAFAALEPHRYVLTVQPPYFVATRLEVDATAGRDVDVGILVLRRAAICDQTEMARPRFKLALPPPSQDLSCVGESCGRPWGCRGKRGCYLDGRLQSISREHRPGWCFSLSSRAAEPVHGRGQGSWFLAFRGSVSQGGGAKEEY
jgi:hypothetical protein